MQNCTHNVVNTSVGAIPLATITVTKQDGTPAQLFSDNGVTALESNSVTSDKFGNFSFYAANGRYSLVIDGTDITTQVFPDVLLYDPADEAPLTQAQAAAPTGAAMIGHGSTSVASLLDSLPTNMVLGDQPLTATPAWDAVPSITSDAGALNETGGPLNAQAQALLNRAEAARAGVLYVEAFRKDGNGLTLSDSNTIRAALDHIGSTLVGKMSFLRFEAGREYVYDRTAELGYISNLVIDLNGATLKRAPASATVTTLAQDADTGQADLYLNSIPDNWEVGDFLVAFNGPSFAQTSPDPIRITAISRDVNKVTLLSGLGSFGGYTSIIPAGCSVGKSFSAFAGRPSSAEAQSMLAPGVNENVHIRNGIIDGNKANQVNNSWRYASEIFIQGKLSSVTGISFKDTTADCIVGHGLKVSENRFLNLGGSCFHTSVHDDTLSQNSMSWFVHNFVDGCNQATNAINGHAEGAVTFSWGAGRLVVAHNDLRNGTESVLGQFGPSTGAMPDKWLICTNNICNNFKKLFYNITAPVEGVVVLDNILINIASISSETSQLMASANCSVGGNILIGSDAITGAYRASNAVFGPMAGGTINQLKMVARSDAVAGFDYRRLTDNVAAIEGTNALLAVVTADNGKGGLSFFSKSGQPAGSYYIYWDSAKKRMKFHQNEAGALLELPADIIAPSLPTHADNATATAGGLAVGCMYKTATGEVRVVV